jgi:hypothetical protein
MVFLNLFLFIFFFILILFSILGYGFYASSFLGIRNSNLSFGIFGLLGIFFSTLLSYFTHLFFAHNIYHNLLFHLVGLILFYFFYSKNYILYKTEIKKLFLIIVFFISCLFLSKNNEDFPYYHLPYFESKPEGSTLRVWCTGCSTGEEAYSVAILLKEHIEKIK